MKHYTFLAAILFLFFAGCEKDSTTDPSKTGSSVFTSGNIKVSPVYFSFSANDSVVSSSSWDLKLTTLFAPDDSLRQFAFPGIALNSHLGVLATFVDTKYENVDPAAVMNFRSDDTDTLDTDSTRNIKTMPVYYSFDNRDTTTANGDWDIEWTVNSFFEPMIVLNKNRGVTGKTLDNTDFTSLSAASVTALESDINDTTLAIGTKCFLYDPATHKLNPVANRVFVIRTLNGARVKFQTLTYYNGAGASGYPTIRFIAPERYSIGTFCLSYDGATHHLDPYADRTFVVKTHDGKFAKFKMLTYYNATGASGYMKFEYEVK